MRRLLVTYRWELWLFIAIPTIVLIATFPYRWFPIVEEGSPAFLQDITRHAVATLLLGAAYSRVRGLGRPLLSLVWRYSLTVAVVSAVAYLAAELLDDGGSAFRFGLLLTAVRVAGLAVLLWFARQASGISLAHAFLLIALTYATRFPGARILDYPSVPYGRALLGAEGIVLASSLLAVWALAHFDSLDRGMRMRSIVALFALSGLRVVAVQGIVIAAWIAPGGYMATAISGLGSFSSIFLLPTLTLGLTYLVRVRPRPE